MSVSIGQWLRIKPSGYVHFINGRDLLGRYRTLCGVWKNPDQLTDEYPPLGRHCQVCADKRGPANMPLGVPR